MSTPERQNYLSFTRPYLISRSSSWPMSGAPNRTNCKDLYGLKIAVVENYAPHELLRTHNPDLNLVAMPNVSSTLQALATGAGGRGGRRSGVQRLEPAPAQARRVIRQRRNPLSLSTGNGSTPRQHNAWSAFSTKSWRT